VHVVADVTGYFRRFPTEQLPVVPLPWGSLPNALDGTSSAGSSANYSRGDHKHGIAAGAITNTMITGPIDGAKIASTGLNADTVDGQHANVFASTSHIHSAADITSGTLSNNLFSAVSDLSAEGYLGNAAGDISLNNGMLQSSLNADLLDGQHASAFALSSHNHDAAYVNVTGDSMSGTLNVLIPSGGSHGISSITSSTALGAAGVEAKNFGAGFGLNAYSASSHAVVGQTVSISGYGGYFSNSGGSGMNRGVAVAGFSGSGSSADTHPSGSLSKAGGEFAGPNGVIGAASNDGTFGFGVIGIARSGDSSTGIYGLKVGGGNYAGYFSGNVYVYGTLSATTKAFKIDHPLDPANKYLMHYAIESPTVQNMYNGTIVLDAYGEAVVQLPDYFEAVNAEDFTYTLTPIGASMPGLHVAEEVQNNQFKISGGLGGKKVSWVLIAQRNDPWVKNNPAKDVVDKPKEEAGTYLYPQGHGQPESLSLTSVHMQRQTKP
jgi:hypothetical protein